MKANMIFLHALSPLHAGTGQGIGVIDLPVAREKATGIPILPGSSLKGVLRDACDDEKIRTAVFGPDTSSAEMGAGLISVSDLRLALLPVRSLRGTFAWVTSPLLLQRLKRDAGMTGMTGVPDEIPAVEKDEGCLVTGITLVLKDKVILEDLDLDSSEDSDLRQWATWIGAALFPDDQGWRDKLVERLCMVSDDLMGYLLEVGTEVNARISLDSKTKTVRKGALWYEETLPAESVLVGLVAGQERGRNGTGAAEVFTTVGGLIGKPLQVGGSATTGRGLCRVHMLSEAAGQEG